MSGRRGSTSRNTKSSRSYGREVKTFARRSLPHTYTPQRRVNLNSFKLDIARTSGVDNRRFQPSPRRVVMYRPPRTIYGTRAPARVAFGHDLRAQYVFKMPAITADCVRRHQRREVMHARGYAGKRLGYKRIRLNSSSYVRC